MSDDRRFVPAAAPWVDGFGYARAVRIGQLIEVAGTVGLDAGGKVAGLGDVYEQTKTALGIILRALDELGASADQVIRTRVFLRNIEDWPEAGRAHAEVFRDILPASSCVGGCDLLAPELLVEIEATAVVPDPA